MSQRNGERDTAADIAKTVGQSFAEIINDSLSEFVTLLSGKLTAHAAVVTEGSSDTAVLIDSAWERGAHDALVELARAAQVRIPAGSNTADVRRSLISAILGGDTVPPPGDLDIREAIAAAADAMGVDINDCDVLSSLSAARRQALRRVRWAVWHVLRDIGYSFPTISRLDVLGTCHHSTIMYAVDRVGSMPAKSGEGLIMRAGIAAAREVLQPKEEDE